MDQAHLTLTPVKFDALCVRLSALLPKKEGWHTDLLIWGDEESDDVQVWFEGDSIDSIAIRLDVSHLSLPLISGLCAIARDFDWILATTEGMVLRPTTEAVFRAVLKSPAQRFVTDPESFLAKIASQTDLPD